VRTNQADHAVATLCRVLGLSRSGYYAWCQREPSNRAQEDYVLRDKIRQFHKVSKGTYGSPRIHADLHADGKQISRKRVARLMKDEGLRGVCRRKYVTTTVRDEAQRPAPDLVERNFTADGPNKVWVADITYVPTYLGFLYLAVVLDVWSRRIVGWSMQTSLETQVVLDALEMAITRRRPEGVIHHSDQGSQYTSIAFGMRAKKHGISVSMGTVGDCYDNAMCESFFATLECELLDRESFSTHGKARQAIFEFIEGFYNPRRRHSALGYLSPCDFEDQHAVDIESEEQAA